MPRQSLRFPGVRSPCWESLAGSRGWCRGLAAPLAELATPGTWGPPLPLPGKLSLGLSVETPGRRVLGCRSESSAEGPGRASPDAHHGSEGSWGPGHWGSTWPWPPSGWRWWALRPQGSHPRTRGNGAPMPPAAMTVSSNATGSGLGFLLSHAQKPPRLRMSLSPTKPVFVLRQGTPRMGPIPLQGWPGSTGPTHFPDSIFVARASSSSCPLPARRGTPPLLNLWTGRAGVSTRSLWRPHTPWSPEEARSCSCGRYPEACQEGMADAQLLTPVPLPHRDPGRCAAQLGKHGGCCEQSAGGCW